MTKNWGYLTGWQKHLLGVDVPKSVQQGWTYYANETYKILKLVHQKNPGQSVSIDSAKALAIAQAVGTRYPGFYDDYVRSLHPLYDRLIALKLGNTAGSKKAWSTYLNTYIRPLAEQVGGPVTDSGPHLVERAKKFNTTLWTNLMEWGPAVGGVGWADVPTPQNPNAGGGLYQRAMNNPAITDPEFKREFQQMVEANPNFIKILFANGG